MGLNSCLKPAVKTEIILFSHNCDFVCALIIMFKQLKVGSSADSSWEVHIELAG